MISKIARHNYSYYKNHNRFSYSLYEGNLRKFSQDYLSDFPLQPGEPFNLQLVLQNAGLTNKSKIEKLFSNLFPNEKSLSPKFMQEIFSLSHHVQEDQFLVQFLIGLCTIDNENIQKKYQPIFLKLDDFIKKSFPPFFYLKTTPTKSEMKDLFSRINECERELKTIIHMQSGISDIDKKSLLSFSKNGVVLNFLSNIISNQYITIDKAETPILKHDVSLGETSVITDVEAFACNTAGGMIMAYWRKINRLASDDLRDLKLYYSQLMVKLIEIYDQQPLALRPIPLTQEILKQAKRYNSGFSQSRMRKILEKPQSPIPDSLPISNSVSLKSSSSPVFQAPVPLVSARSLSLSHQSPISSIPSSPDISSTEQSLCSSVQTLSPVHSQNSSPSLSPTNIREINEGSLKYPFKIDQIRALKNAIKKVKQSSYHEESVKIFVKEIRELKRDIPDFKVLMHDVIFKSTTDKWKFWKRSKLWEKNSTRGTFFGQLLQLNEKVSNPCELKSLIQFGFQCYPSESMNIHDNIQTLMDENKKQLLKTNWKDRNKACRTIENIIVRVNESELTRCEKQMILECLYENIKDSTAQMTSSLEEKRNLHRSEAPTIALGLQSYNVTRFIGANQFKNGAKVASDLTGAILPSFTFPMNSLMSKTNTTTKKSILSMIRGGMNYIRLTNENKIGNKISPQKIVQRMNSILNKNKDIKSIEGRDLADIKSILRLAKNHGYLHFLLDYLHENKNYILFELMKKLPENDFNDLLRMSYPLKSLIDIKIGEDLLKHNSLRKFSNFMCDNLKLASKAKKETTFVAVKTMAYLVHLHDKINLLAKNSEERLHHEKIYQQCYVRFNEHIKNGIKYKQSAFRILTKTRSSSVNFFYKSIGKIIGRVFTSRISLLIQPFVFGALGILGAPFGLILLGFAITISAYIFRLVISAVFDNPDFYHSAKTLTYSTLLNEIPKLPHFNHNKDEISFLSTRDKMKEFNCSIKFHSTDEIKIQFEKILGSLHEEDQFLSELNKEIKEMKIEDETKRAEIVFEKILDFSSLTNSTCIIDKSNLLDNLIRSVYLSLNCSLSKKEKKKLFALFEKEMADTKSNLGQLRRQNSYVRENNYFKYDALTSVYCIFGLVGNVVLTPVLSKVSVWLSSICNSVITSLGYPIKDFVQNKKDKNSRPYASTASSIEAKLFLKLTREHIKKKSRPKSGILIEQN